MNSSPVSSAKCGSSDFSIERILSEDSSREGGEEAPSWLCSTRYQSPRLPRAKSEWRARRPGWHARIPFTVEQAAALEAAYARARYLAPPTLYALAATLQLRDHRIKVWFQNRRARERQEKSGSIKFKPPRAVTLPSNTSAQTTSNNLWIPMNDQAFHTQFDIRRNGINNFAGEIINSSSNLRNEANDLGEINTSGANRCFRQSCSSASIPTEVGRYDSPLDVESVD